MFISEFLIKLRIACGAGTEHFDAEQYQREREAFGSLIMGWRSCRTIDIYDHTRDGEKTLFVLAAYQQDVSQRRFISEPRPLDDCHDYWKESAATNGAKPLSNQKATVWIHDEETLVWVKVMQQQARVAGGSLSGKENA